jgi:hypothetical protein
MANGRLLSRLLCGLRCVRKVVYVMLVWYVWDKVMAFRLCERRSEYDNS